MCIAYLCLHSLTIIAFLLFPTQHDDNPNISHQRPISAPSDSLTSNPAKIDRILACSPCPTASTPYSDHDNDRQPRDLCPLTTSPRRMGHAHLLDGVLVRKWQCIYDGGSRGGRKDGLSAGVSRLHCGVAHYLHHLLSPPMSVSSMYPLQVGKFVNAARGMGLARESSSSASTRRSKLASGGGGGSNDRRGSSSLGGGGGGAMAGVVFTSDALGHHPYIPPYFCAVKLPACSLTIATIQIVRTSKQQLLDTMEQDGYGSEDDAGGDFSHGNGMAMQWQRQHEEYYAAKQRRHRPAAASASATHALCGAGDGARAVDRDEAYLGARFSVNTAPQSIKSRIVHPDCCCGYTLDQAASLEDFSATGASTNSSTVVEDYQSPFHDPAGTTDKEDRILKAQSCELEVKVYTPFLRYAAAMAAAGAAGGSSSGLQLGHMSSPSGSTSGFARNNSPAAAAMSSPAS
ncbi:hypothetical protein BDZ97DRAFT_1921368 [Flammula alnicola]|nr:hypothetical protein BDZ97DRAFT_1921368 [Flammula alnicola]